MHYPIHNIDSKKILFLEKIFFFINNSLVNNVGVKIEYNFLLRIFHKDLLKILSCGYPEILKINLVFLKKKDANKTGIVIR